MKFYRQCDQWRRSLITWHGVNNRKMLTWCYMQNINHSLTFIFTISERQQEWGTVENVLPSASSAPNTIAREPDTPRQWSRESWRRLKLISAASTPTLARPSQSATCKGLLSMKRATTSPETHPWALAQWATALDNSSSCVKVHVSPVAS